MSVNKRLTETLHHATVIPFNKESKFVLFSDCHRGVNDWADDFAHNQSIFFYALQWYNQREYTYIEVGDGDEMWENRDFNDIRQAHSHVFWEMAKFHQAGRFLMIYGNHDMEKREPKVLARDFYSYYEERSGEQRPLFPNMVSYESLLLKPSDGGKPILVLHGHQADPVNDRYWWVGRLFSRCFWKPLQLVGLHDFTSPAKNYSKRLAVDQRLIDWTASRNLITIAGHTHRSRFPDKYEVAYYNTGSCVHPRSITGLEIKDGEIMLVKWAVTPDQNGTLRIERQLLEGPRRLIGD